MKKLVTCFLCLFLFPTLALGGEWVGPANILSIEVQPNGYAYVQIDATTPNLACPQYVSGWLQLDTVAPHFKEQYALLISAQLASRPVKFFVNVCGNVYAYAQNTVLQ